MLQMQDPKAQLQEQARQGVQGMLHGIYRAETQNIIETQPQDMEG